jgi:hypothetical protein
MICFGMKRQNNMEVVKWSGAVTSKGKMEEDKKCPSSFYSRHLKKLKLDNHRRTAN